VINFSCNQKGKAWCKPLLKQRHDLVLMGRLLIMRPVRHLLRGVIFEPTSDKYRFHVVRYVAPLFPVEGGFSYRQEIHSVEWKVWQPYFKDMLLDSLAEDIFERVGRISSLGDFASKLDVTYLNGHDRFQLTRVTALILAGQRDGAAQLVDEIEDPKHASGLWRQLMGAATGLAPARHGLRLLGVSLQGGGSGQRPKARRHLATSTISSGGAGSGSDRQMRGAAICEGPLDRATNGIGGRGARADR